MQGDPYFEYAFLSGYCRYLTVVCLVMPITEGFAEVCKLVSAP